MRQKRTWWLSAVTAIALTGALAAPPVLAVPTTAEGAAEPITDPIPEDPERASLGLVLEEYAQLPATDPIPDPTDERLMRHNRINYIGEVPDESGRRYVPDLNGPLYLLDGKDQHVYLDFASRFDRFFSGRGLGSGFGFVTFHPEFAKNGKFYTVHTEDEKAIETEEPTYPNQPDATVQSVVTEWTASDPGANEFHGTHREIFRFGFTTQIHAIQQIDFNPTARPADPDYGLLYLAVGDGGIGVGTDVPQDLTNPAGKILRIDPSGDNGPNGAYGIPPDNPFVGQQSTLGEIYAYGMRDPHRFTWDPAGRNAMYLGHIGQHAIEAVYEVRAGDNLGWSEREGRFRFDPEHQCYLYPLPDDDAELGYTYPVAAYDHDPPLNWPCNSDSGHAISGGQVYRGAELPQLRGKYIFGDLVDGQVFYTDVARMKRGAPRAPIHELQLFDTSGTQLRMSDFVADGRVDLRFGMDTSDNLYLLAKANGKIWRVADTRPAVPSEVTKQVAGNLVAHYDFERPFAADDTQELDRGDSNTLLELLNGGTDMRVPDGAFPGSNNALQLRQVAPEQPGNDDWKAGVWSDDGDGVESLRAFNGADGMTIMGWFKMTGENPSPNPTAPDPRDRFNAVGLAGVLSGDSDGHDVRALLELIEVDGELKLVALGRRLDGGASQTFAAHNDWQQVLPPGQWVHLAATFDFTTGTMALYANGKPLPGSYTVDGDPWQVDGTGTTASNPRGIKIGGSFPQNDRERNPCNCRADSLMFLDTAADASVIKRQYQRFFTR
ncbi:concanavalin A-like lectin/glucanase superfamily protein [Tamaricihabitans halophyticus]|uniref:Concanavalin A-like lectin/glucanase superfamily protein n=1 Tax=Tamaricihabitans halophyticus TaxID=1262583 RepID=A0A4R2QFF9_9PSEU|nr:PQQ-dependent sugar dehydrogenase [Tamaricihabitans halophyticus]TCP47873.1 concanavalin A-like lectin/glucanase superfamily protein [Tamaricihabitans halophyticus]